MLVRFIRACFKLPLGLFARSAWPLGLKIQAILLSLMTVVLLSCLVSVLLLVNLSNDDANRSEANARVQSVELINQYLNSELDLYADAVVVSQRSSVNDTFSNRLNNALIDLSRVRFQDNPSGRNIRSYLNDLLTLYPKLGDVLGQINGYLSNRQFKEALTLYQQESSLFNQTKELVGGLKTEIVAEQQKLSLDARNTINFSILIASLLAGFTLLTLVAVSFLLTFALGGAIGQIKNDLDKVAAGELNVVVRTEHRDEIGEVVAVINQALDRLRQVILSSAIGRKVSLLAEDLASTSSQQASLAELQASSVAQSSTSMHELTNTVRQILSNSTDVAQAASSALDEAEEVRQRAGEVDSASHRVQDAVSNSRSLANQMEERAKLLANQLQALNTQSQEVAEITSFINNVANQTHILSINAAIEAAGAGEYGERFSVVASEVKGLAHQVTGNTKKIRELLESIQENIQMTTDNAGALLEEVAQLHTAENEVTEGLKGLTENARRSVDKAERIVWVTQITVGLTREIEQSIRQHEATSSQIVGSLLEIKSVAESNSYSSRLLQVNSSELEQLAQQLNTALDSVKLA